MAGLASGTLGDLSRILTAVKGEHRECSPIYVTGLNWPAGNSKAGPMTGSTSAEKTCGGKFASESLLQGRVHAAAGVIQNSRRASGYRADISTCAAVAVTAFHLSAFAYLRFPVQRPKLFSMHSDLHQGTCASCSVQDSVEPLHRFNDSRELTSAMKHVIRGA